MKKKILFSGILISFLFAAIIYALIINRDKNESHNIEVLFGNEVIQTSEIDTLYTIAVQSAKLFDREAPSREEVRNELITMKLIEPLFKEYDITLDAETNRYLDSTFKVFFQNYDAAIKNGTQAEKEQVNMIKQSIDEGIQASGLTKEEYINLAIYQTKYQYKKLLLIETFSGDKEKLKNKAMEPVRNGLIKITFNNSDFTTFEFAM